MNLTTNLKQLNKALRGDLYIDELYRSIYATDASVYRKKPLAVCYPKNEDDLVLLVNFATSNKVSLVLRTAGTSLAGQCVGDGIIVDVSKHFTKILSFDKTKKTVTVQPGVIRDELNLFLKRYGLFFGPNTSTSNRCMIGGMVGNNSSGTTSIQYGVTRDKVRKIKGLLTDGSNVIFETLHTTQFKEKCALNSSEGKIYSTINSILSDKKNQNEIKAQFPKKKIHRRNTGYAIDNLLDFELFGGSNTTINLCNILCGSEGTLAISTEITLQLDVLPDSYSIMVASHFNSIQESLEAVQIAMKHNLHMCELMDKAILDCTKNNRTQIENRFFIQGDPAAILMLEIKANSQTKVLELAENLINDLSKHNFGYAHVKISQNNTAKVIDLRKAGLGLLGNIIGDHKAVACIEDTAVALEDLPSYIAEFTQIMKDNNQDAIYYAHAGAGELHLRPILNLKKRTDVVKFKDITQKVATLVKKYNGSFSGEHGDGIVRSEFIPFMIGAHNYNLLKEIKQAFDPDNIFNKGKIISPFKMDESLRYQPNRKEPKIDTIQNFEDNKGILRLAEKCNGSGDCRKSVNAGGVMCPSYRATKDEKDTTRARANALREFLTKKSDLINPFDYKELKDVFDLCISCKACSSECPSNVDVSALKSEFLFQYYKSNKPTFRDKLFANNEKYNGLLRLFPKFSNAIINSKVIKRTLNIALERKLPLLQKKTFKEWIKNNTQLPTKNKKSIYLFIDEFTNNYDVKVGIDAYELLQKIGYNILVINNCSSGRSQISKGFLKEAKACANKNINLYKDVINKDTPLIGIEPSAILSFRDDYLRLANDVQSAKKVAEFTFTIEEFIASEIALGNIKSSQFTNDHQVIKIHTHCHQKSLSQSKSTFEMLNIPKNYKVSLMSTGCCGMAGSFGYEKEHYDISMQMGENSVFPKVRNTAIDTKIAVAGTSCRHQIKDGTQRETQHPVSILKDALLLL